MHSTVGQKRTEWLNGETAEWRNSNSIRLKSSGPYPLLEVVRRQEQQRRHELTQSTPASPGGRRHRRLRSTAPKGCTVKGRGLELRRSKWQTAGADEL